MEPYTTLGPFTLMDGIVIGVAEIHLLYKLVPVLYGAMEDLA
jgi:hypothetical protein